MEENDDKDCYLLFETTAGVVIRDLFNTLTPILVDGNLVFTKNGLEIRQCTRIMFVGAEIFGAKIEKYIYQPPADKEYLALGISFGTLCQCFKGVSANDIVSFRVTRKSYMNNTMIITFTSDDCTQYEVRLLALEYEPNVMPSFDVDTVVTLPSDKFQSVIQKADKQAEHIQILADVQDSRVFFVADGDECGFKACFNFTPIGTDDTLRKTYMIRDLSTVDKCRYVIRHLLAVSKATNMSSDVRLLLPNKEQFETAPLIIEYKIGAIGIVTFCVACNKDEAQSTLESIKAELAGLPRMSTNTSTNLSSTTNIRKKARRQSITNAYKRLDDVPTVDMPWKGKVACKKRKKIIDDAELSDAPVSAPEDNGDDDDNAEIDVDYRD